MRKISTLAAVLVLAMLVSVQSAFAGISFDDGHVSLGNYSGPGYVNAQFSSDLGLIKDCSLDISSIRSNYNYETDTHVLVPNGGWIHVYFSGVMTPLTEVTSLTGSSMSIWRGVHDFYGGVYSSVVDENANNGGGKGEYQDESELLAPHFVSQAGANFSGFGSFTIDGIATYSYSEGRSNENEPMYFSATASFPIIWTTSTPIGEFPMLSIGTPTSVPEPASISLLVLSGAALAFRRRQR